MKISKLIVVVLAGLLASVSSATAATQMEARDAPSVSGPLEQRAKDCRRQNETFRGTIVAVGKTCL
ncbi:MAG TPA: hypothetical protein VFK89_07045, partial [Actinomycetota bacterium]|nr:hypothetical protein [Actinomycetota bacterium]